MAQSKQPVVLTLSPGVRAGAVVAGLLLLAVLAVLIGVLVSLESTRSEIRTTRAGVLATDRHIAHLEGHLDPLLEAAAPLAGEQTQRKLDHAATRAGQGLDAVTSIATTLDRAQLGGTLTSVRALTHAALRAFPDIQALLRSQRRLNRRAVATQLRQLAVLERSYNLLAQSLSVQREVLQHTRSLDAKTGGPPPAVPAAGLTKP